MIEANQKRIKSFLAKTLSLDTIRMFVLCVKFRYSKLEISKMCWKLQG